MDHRFAAAEGERIERPCFEGKGGGRRDAGLAARFIGRGRFNDRARPRQRLRPAKVRPPLWTRGSSSRRPQARHGKSRSGAVGDERLAATKFRRAGECLCFQALQADIFPAHIDHASSTVARERRATLWLADRQSLLHGDRYCIRELSASGSPRSMFRRGHVILRAHSFRGANHQGRQSSTWAGSLETVAGLRRLTLGPGHHNGAVFCKEDKYRLSARPRNLAPRPQLIECWPPRVAGRRLAFSSHGR